MYLVDRKTSKFLLGWTFGFFLLYYFNNYTYGIEELIERSISFSDNGLLILAAARHIFFDVLFALLFLAACYFLPPNYLIPANIVAITVLSLFAPSPEPVILILSACIGYFLLRGLHGRNLDTIAAFLVLLQLLFGFEWLVFADIFNGFIHNYGDVSRDIRIAAEYTKGLFVLNFVSTFLCIAFVLSALFSARLFSYYNASMENAERRKKEEMALQEMRMRAEEARMLQEMHALVHDLKTPLMTVQGLNSLVEMFAEGDKIKEYCKRISAAVDNVNEMVSEILYDEVRKEIEVLDFINYVRAHVLVKFQGQHVHIDIEENLPKIKVNHIRMARALTNLIQNAFAATAGMDDGKIIIIASREKNNVVFIVQDNGIGIDSADLEEIWNIGFSTKNSSGLGLSFVKRVVENHGGEISIVSENGKGTIAKITLPGVNEDD